MWLLCLFIPLISGQRVPVSLAYYETVDPSSLSHSIVKRGADPTRQASSMKNHFEAMIGLFSRSTHRFNKIREVGFTALGREFRLVLSPTNGLLHPNFKVEPRLEARSLLEAPLSLISHR